MEGGEGGEGVVERLFLFEEMMEVAKDGEGCWRTWRRVIRSLGFYFGMLEFDELEKDEDDEEEEDGEGKEDMVFH